MTIILFSISSLVVFLALLRWGEGWVTKSNGFSWEQPWALSLEGPGSGGWFLGGYDGGTSCLRPPDEMCWSRSDGVGGCWGSPLGGGVPQGVLGQMGALVVPQTGPIRSSPPKVPAGGWGSWGEQRLGSLTNLLRWRRGLESALGLDMAAPQPGPGGCLFIASAAGGLLTAREKEMKGRGGTSYHLLMLSDCVSFQCCKTRAGLAGSWWKRRQSSPGNTRELEGGGSLGDGKVWVFPQNCQRLEESERAREWQGERN